MDINFISLVLSLLTLALVIFIFLNSRNRDENKSKESEYIENKLETVSKEINEIENQLTSVTTPINELNRFLGGNVTTGRLGEWNLESIVKDVMPDGNYEFQKNINPETQDRVDCAIETADGLIIPIDSKFYAGQYKQYQDASQANIRSNVLRAVSYTHLRAHETS